MMRLIGKIKRLLINREFTGQHSDKVHSNVFYKGIQEFTIHNELLPVPGDGIAGSHIYTLDWKKDSLTWIIDGKPARTLFRENSTSPMVLFLLSYDNRLLKESDGIPRLLLRSRFLFGMVEAVLIKEPRSGQEVQLIGEILLAFMQHTNQSIFSAMTIMTCQ